MSGIPVLTIDGPSGAGKGTVSRQVALILGWHYLDSGSIYRALAISLEKNQINHDDVNEIIKIAKTMQLDFKISEQFHAFLNNEDITARLGTETTGKMASKVAAIPEVRQVLLGKQKEFRKPPGLVADGRDMGTVVFPDADIKVFLTASAESRAKRRYIQLIENGIDANINNIFSDIQERDKRDQERTIAPLVQAPGAFFLDSTTMAIPDVVAKVLSLVPQHFTA